MQVARYLGDSDLEKLTARLFDFEVARSDEVAKRAKAALLKANPRLADLASVPSGTTIIVPRVDGAGASTETTMLNSPDRHLLNDMGSRLGEFRPRLLDAVNREIHTIRSSLDTLTSRELKALARKNKTFGARLKEVEGRVKARVEQLESLKPGYEKSLDQLERVLEQFEKGLGRF